MTYFSIFLLRIIQLRFVYHIDVFLLHIYTKKDPYKGILKKDFTNDIIIKIKIA